jgi:uncharacterized protein YdhG (YjbR/CyaY superfamily)
MKSANSAPPKDIDDYLALVPRQARIVLDKLRRTIHSAAPKATEKISYRIPTFDYLGALVALAAFKDHCSLFPMSLSVIAAHKDELKSFKVSKGTIRFTIDHPLPGTVVKSIVKERMAQNEARRESRLEREARRQKARSKAIARKNTPRKQSPRKRS